MAESYLDKSKYPIDPNMQLDLPDPNPSPEIQEGGDISVSSSQAPAPNDTQKVDVAPTAPIDMEEVEKDSFSVLNEKRKAENTATYAALKDVSNIVKYIHTKRNAPIATEIETPFGNIPNDDIMPISTQDAVTSMVDGILDSRMNRGKRLASELMVDNKMGDDVRANHEKNKDLALDNLDNTVNSFKNNIRENLSKRGYDITSDKDITIALSKEFDKNKDFFIGEKAMDIGKAQMLGHGQWLEGTVWNEVFNADSKDIYLNLISTVNKHLQENEYVSEVDAKRIYLNYARAVLTLDDSAYFSSVSELEKATNTEYSALISGVTDKPLIDFANEWVATAARQGLIDNLPSVAQLTLNSISNYHDIGWDESSALDAMRRNISGRDVDWNSEHGQNLYNELLTIAEGDESKALRYKQYLSDPELNDAFSLSANATWHAIRDTFRDFTTGEGIGFLLMLAKGRGWMQSLLGMAGLSTPTAGVVAGGTAMTFITGAGVYGAIHSTVSGKQSYDRWVSGEASNYQTVYEQTQNLLHLGMSAFMAKHGLKQPVGYSTFKSRDGKTYTLPTAETAWDWTVRQLKPNYRLKQPALVNENFNNYVHKINANHYKSSAEFKDAFLNDPNVPARLKVEGMPEMIYDNAGALYAQGHGWNREVLPQVEKITGKNITDNVKYAVIEKEPVQNVALKKVRNLRVEVENIKGEVKNLEKIEAEGSTKKGIAGLTETYTAKIDLKNAKNKLNEKVAELEKAKVERKTEIATNKDIKAKAQNEGDLIIWSNYRTSLKDWAYIRIGKNDGKVYIGNLPKGVEPLKGGEINYFSIKGDKVPGITKEMPASSSIVESYTGHKLSARGSAIMNGIFVLDKVRPRYGDKAGESGEYVYTGSKFGWRNMVEDGVKSADEWLAAANRMDKTLFDGGRLNDYVKKFKAYTRKFPKFDLPVPTEKYSSKFTQPDARGNIYTGNPNHKLFKVSEKIKLDLQKRGVVVKDQYKIIDGNEPWFKEVQKELAKGYEKLEHRPNYGPLKESYESLGKELVSQWKILEKEGFEIEVWKGKGEPYKNSAEAMKDMANGHLYIRQTKNGFGPMENLEGVTVSQFIKEMGLPDKFQPSVRLGKEMAIDANGNFHPHLVENYPMLRQSGIKAKSGENLTYNDLFRGIHDYMHHGKSGNGFGQYGEMQGFIDGLSTLPESAHLAFFSETAMQNSFYNFFGKYANQKSVYAPKLYNMLMKHIAKPLEKASLVEPTSPFVNRANFKEFINNSDKLNFDRNGGNWAVIANDVTDVRGVKFILDKLGDKDINFNGYSLKKHLNKIKDLPIEEVNKVNKKFLDDYIRNAEKDGKVIHIAEGKGWYENKSETSNILTGDISTTDMQIISLFFGQKSFLNNFGEVFATTPRVNGIREFRMQNEKPSSDIPYTEITTQDGHVSYLVGKGQDIATLRQSSTVDLMNRYGEFDANNTNFFTSASDMAKWRETFGPNGKFDIDPIPQDINLANQNRLTLEKKVIEDGYLVIDWANVSHPHNIKMMEQMYAKNKKLEFRYHDKETGNLKKTTVEYVFDETLPNMETRFITDREPLVLSPKELGQARSIDEQAILSGANKKIIKTKEMPVVEGDPITPNKGLSDNHLGNINLSKLPKETREVLTVLLDEIGNKKYTELVRRFIGHEEQVAQALKPKNFENTINMLLTDGHKNGVWKKDGTVNELIRTNHVDVIGSQFFMVELLNKYQSNPSKYANLVPIIKKVAMATHKIRENAGRTLNAMQVEINGEKMNFDNLSMLGGDELAAIYSIFSEPEPATLLQKFVELRRNNLLSSASSVTRSFFGNTGNLLLQLPIKLVSGSLNQALTAFDYGIRGGKWDPLANYRAMDAFHFTEGFLKTKKVPNLMWDILKGKEAVLSESSLAKREGWYSTPKIGGKLGTVVTTPQRIQIMIDAMIRKPAENGFLHEFAHKIARSEKLSGEAYRNRVNELINNPSAEMITQAKTSAEYITFQAQLGKMGRMFNRIRTGKGTEAIQIFVPFFNTSANIMKTAYNMTPLGVATPKYFRAASEGIRTGNWGKFSDQTARVSVGTAILYWMGQALGDGQYNYEGDWKDEDKAIRELKGKLGYQPNSIWWKDIDGDIKSFSTLGYEPLASLLNIAATWKEGEGEDFTDRSAKVMTAWVNQFAQNPFMQGTQDLQSLVEGFVSGGEKGKDAQTYFTRLLLSSFVPNMIMQGGKIKDDIRYEPAYREERGENMVSLTSWYNSIVTEFRYVGGDKAVPKVNLFGEPVRVADPKGALLALRVSEGEENETSKAITEEILRLAPNLGDLSFEMKYKNLIQLTPKQRFLLEVAAGREFYAQLKRMMSDSWVMENGVVAVDENNNFIAEEGQGLNSSWKSMPDAAKIKMIKAIQEQTKKAQLFGVAPELFVQSEYGNFELMDPEDFVVYKEGGKSAGLEERDVIKEQLTKKYRESAEGSLEVERATQSANEVITLMRQGIDKGEAIDNVIQKLIEGETNE